LHRLFFLSLEADPSTFATFDGATLASSIETMESSTEGPLSDHLWVRLEPIYISSRRKLLQSRKWRYGPLFVWDNAKPVFDKLAEYNISVEGKVYCDLGCGTHHPYGTSAIMYINGAASTIATDMQDADKRRAAEALYDLLQDCLVNPDSWHWSSVTREEYLTRIQNFNFKALREGNLEVGLVSVPLKHIVTSIYEPSIPSGGIDIISSRAVLEHFLDFEIACHKLWALMSPGSIAYHLIDLVDHRSYGSLEYHQWSFLAEDEQWSDGVCNRLRASEIYKYFENTGFEIKACDVTKNAEMPMGFRKQLRGRFASMSDEELNTLQIACLIKKG
jgi:Methyltransferase domain